MNENDRIDEAIEYAKWMIKNLDPAEMYDFDEMRGKLLSIIGYLTILKAEART